MRDNEQLKMHSSSSSSRGETSENERVLNRGIDVTHYSSTMEMRKETIRAGVFQPGHNLPTMSLKEYAVQEYNEAMARSELEKNAPDAPKRYDQLETDGQEDDDALVEVAVYRDRNWDNWKDANPLGLGNKKWTQF